MNEAVIKSTQIYHKTIHSNYNKELDDVVFDALEDEAFRIDLVTI